MTATVDQLATALTTPLESAGIRALEYRSDQLNPPVAIVATMGVEYHGAFGAHGLSTHHFALMLIVGRIDDRAAYKALEGYMSNSGSLSVRQLLEADPTLGGVAQALIVHRAQPPVGIQVENGPTYTSVTWDVDVFSE